MLAYFPPAN